MVNQCLEAVKLVQNSDSFLVKIHHFFSKGHGHSHMVSDFLVQHPSGPFFELNADEWKQVAAKYKTLSADTDVDYFSQIATASINIETEAYLDNDTILSQFERLF